MYILFSLINNIPNIHTAYDKDYEETYIEELLLNLSKKYIIDKMKNLIYDPFSDIKEIIKIYNDKNIEELYPLYTLQKIDSKTIELYIHESNEYVDKGWIYNSKKKITNNEKIGYFKILLSGDVIKKNIDILVPDFLPQVIQNNYDQIPIEDLSTLLGTFNLNDNIIFKPFFNEIDEINKPKIPGTQDNNSLNSNITSPEDQKLFQQIDEFLYKNKEGKEEKKIQEEELTNFDPESRNSQNQMRVCCSKRRPSRTLRW